MADVASLPSKITRVRSDGGSPEFVFSSTYYGLRCTRAADGFCVNAEFSADGRQIVFVSFDPRKGKGHELTRYRLDSNDRHPTYLWDLSPDGNNLALARFDTGTIHLLSLNGGSNREIVLKNIESIRAFDFSAEALGFFVYGVKGPAGTLVYTDFAGRVRTVLRHTAPECWAIPSPLTAVELPSTCRMSVRISGKSRIFEIPD
jgi:WD40 repeat protein